MKRTVSLFQFMPYGAPELLAAARPNLARALVLGSMLPIAAFLIALPLVPMFRTVELPRVIRDPGFIVEPPPPIYVEPPPPSIEPAGPTAPDAVGIPVPVPEAQAPEDVTPTPNTTASTNDEPGTRTTSPDVPVTPPAPEPVPTRGAYQYVEELPQSVYEFKPEYPDLARAAGIEGVVLVHALIGKDGRVMRVELDEKKNVPMLNATALEAAMRWKFTPALSNGHPVVVWFAIPFKFVLH